MKLLSLAAETEMASSAREITNYHVIMPEARYHSNQKPPAEFGHPRLPHSRPFLGLARLLCPRSVVLTHLRR